MKEHAMKTAKVIFIFLLMLSISLPAQSLLEEKKPVSSADVIGTSRIDSKFSLFDLSRLEMSHSYSVSYFSSGGSGTTIAMYMNSMKYRISNPLTLKINLAWIHQPGALFSRNRGVPTDYGKILPSFTLEYRPSDKFYLELGYHSYPAYMNYGGSRSSGFWDRYFRQDY
jgi:hypothetical protein